MPLPIVHLVSYDESFNFLDHVICLRYFFVLSLQTK